MATVNLAKEAGFVEADEDDFEEILASHDQELTDDELIQLQKEKIQIEIEHSSEWPES